VSSRYELVERPALAGQAPQHQKRQQLPWYSGFVESIEVGG